MTCDEIADREIAVEYLLGRLTDGEQEAYERHYFECPGCYAALDALKSVRLALGRPTAIPAPAPRRSVQWEWLALAALVVLGVGAALIWSSNTTRQARDINVATGASPTPAVTPPNTPAAPENRTAAVIAQLARAEPPPYVVPRLRGANQEAFDAGMRRYQAHDYAAAIPLLERAAREQADADAARFYLGVSALLAGRPPDAVDALTPLAARGESPYAEEARFFLAKAFLQLQDVQNAMAALDRTIALHGDRERDARDIKQKLAAVSRP